MPPIVLCDGLACDGYIWRYLLPELRRTYQVILWNYRGHGASSVPPDSTRVGLDYACEDLRDLLEHLGIEAAILVGHSMGVQLALEVHRRFPERVLGLVLMCGASGTPLDTFHGTRVLRYAFPPLRDLTLRFPQLASTVARWVVRSELALELARRLETDTARLKREDLSPYFAHLARLDLPAFVRTLDSLTHHTTRAHLPEVNVPTLIIGGERDQFTPVRLSMEMAEAIPNAELMLIPRGTHTAPLEAPAQVWERLHRFLGKWPRHCEPRLQRV